MRRHQRADAGPSAETGQSTVEFALLFPVIVLAMLSMIAVLSVCVSILDLDDTARVIARAASTADDPVAAADELGAKFEARATAFIDPGTGIITVNVSRAARVWFVGLRSSPFVIRSSVTILREPQVILGQ